jgi:DNA replication and repair protein RecF
VYVSSLSLRDFRNYQRLDLSLTPGTTLIYGPNAAGKTSLLESLFFLATTRSSRTSADREIVRWDAEPMLGTPPFARLLAEVARAEGTTRIEVIVQRRADQEGDLLNASQKLVRVDGKTTRALDLVGRLRVVLFTPADLSLVDGPPSERRRYLDLTLSQLDNQYVRLLSHYNKVVQQRNSLLRSGKERKRATQAIENDLAFWDKELAGAASYILAERLRAVHDLNQLVGPIFRDITGTPDPLVISYQSSLALEKELRGDEDRRVLARLVLEQLQRLRPEELARGQTMIGPHRDDLLFSADERNLGVYGSRGQQRAATLALKLGEAELMTQRTGDTPVLLLDDILSELDAERRRHLLAAVVAGVGQTLISATDLDDFNLEFLQGTRRLRVEGGQVFPA